MGFFGMITPNNLRWDSLVTWEQLWEAVNIYLVLILEEIYDALYFLLVLKNGDQALSLDVKYAVINARQDPISIAKNAIEVRDTGREAASTLPILSNILPTLQSFPVTLRSGEFRNSDTTPLKSFGSYRPNVSRIRLDFLRLFKPRSL